LPNAPAKRIATAKGTFEVPGIAFVDGQDPDATPPLTVMRINVWDAVPRRQAVCKLCSAPGSLDTG
jgi:hypothetical protein